MKSLLFLFAGVVLALSLRAQIPESFNYQVIPRDAGNNVYPEQEMFLRISLIPGSPGGLADFVETFTKTTTSLGLINLQIGTGTPVAGTFSGIDWTTGTYFLKVEIDIDGSTGGTIYTDMGTTQLISVPYAMYAKKSADSFSGNYNDLTDKPDLEQFVVPEDINGLPKSYIVRLLQGDEDFLDFGPAGGFTYDTDWTLIEKVRIPAGGTSGWHLFRGKGWADQTGDFAVGLHTGGLQFWLSSGGWRYAAKDTTLLTDKWYVITLSYNKSEGLLSGYIGTRKVAQVASAPADDRSNTNKLFLGGQDVDPSYSVGDLYSEQNMDFAKLDLYKRLLTPAEIASFGDQPLYDTRDLVLRMAIMSGEAINIVNESAAVKGNNPEFISNEFAVFSGNYPDLLNKPEQLNISAGSGINISGAHPDLTISAIPPSGLVPVGSVVAWFKNLTGTPALPPNFAECNGQTINDTESPFNGVTLPDLSNKFLVGSTSSGAEGGTAAHSHTGATALVSTAFPATNGMGIPTVANMVPLDHTHNLSIPSAPNLPPYYTVVWIIRIK